MYERDSDPTLPETAQRHDVEKIVRTLRLVDPRDRAAWIQRLRATRFLRATNAASGQTVYARPTDVYMLSEGLMLYFRGNPAAWFLVPEYDSLTEELCGLGVSREVRVEARYANERGYVILQREPGCHERGLRGFDPACMIDGLDHALDTITAAKAAYLWNNVLRSQRRLIRGIVESATRQTYDGATQCERWSAMGELVTSRPWLPTESGMLARPGDLSADDLPPDFLPDPALAEALGLRQTPLKTLSQEMGYSVAELAYLLQHRDQIADYIKAQEEAKNTADSNNETDVIVVHFGQSLTQVFARPEHSTAPDSDIHETVAPDPVSNPERRLEKAKKDIEDKRRAAAPQPRFAPVPRRIWGARQSRTDLLARAVSRSLPNLRRHLPASRRHALLRGLNTCLATRG